MAHSFSRWREGRLSTVCPLYVHHCKHVLPRRPVPLVTQVCYWPMIGSPFSMGPRSGRTRSISRCRKVHTHSHKHWLTDPTESSVSIALIGSAGCSTLIHWKLWPALNEPMDGRRQSFVGLWSVDGSVGRWVASFINFPTYSLIWRRRRRLP